MTAIRVSAMIFSSLALSMYPVMVGISRVARMARIASTTISSTRVNPPRSRCLHVFLFILHALLFGFFSGRRRKRFTAQEKYTIQPGGVQCNFRKNFLYFDIFLQ